VSEVGVGIHHRSLAEGQAGVFSGTEQGLGETQLL
jgi:hypothetical protein